MYPTVDQTFHLAICGHNSPDRGGRQESIRGFSRLFSHVQNRSRFRALLILVWLAFASPKVWVILALTIDAPQSQLIAIDC